MRSKILKCENTFSTSSPSFDTFVLICIQTCSSEEEDEEDLFCWIRNVSVLSAEVTLPIT